MGVYWSVKMVILSIFAEIDTYEDFKCVFHYQRTLALVISFQNINKDGDLSWQKERNIYTKNGKNTLFWRNMWKPLILKKIELFGTTKNKNI